MRIKELQKQAESPDIDLQGLEKIQEEMQAEAATMQELQTKYVQMQETAYKAGQSIGSAIRGIGTSLKGLMQTGLKGTMSALKGIASTGVNAIKGIAGRIKGIGSHVTSIGSKILNLAKSAFIFNMLSGGFRKMADAAKAAFTDYLNYDASLKKSVNSLKTSLNGLGGQLASAFAPILSVVVPMLSTLVNWCVTAANAVAAFIAAITGKSTYKVAVAGLGDVASGAGGAAGGLNDATDAAKKLKKELGGFDELNVISKDTASSAAGGAGGGGGGGGGAGAGSITYTDAEISSAISDFAERVKDAWAKSDFTEIGEIIGTKLKAAVDAIPWEDIQTTASRIAKSLATLINGFVGTRELGNSIGNALAQAINTGIISVSTFAQNLDWAKVGRFIASQINSTLRGINWSEAITAASSIGRGIATALNNVMTSQTFSNLGRTAASAVNTAIAGAYSFVTTADWSGWGKSVATAITEYFRNLDWKKAGLTFSNTVIGIIKTFTEAVKNTDWHEVGQGIGEMIRNIDWGTILVDAANLVMEVFKGLLDFGTGLFDPHTMSEWHKEIQTATSELEEANKQMHERLDNADDWEGAGDAEAKYLQKLADEYFRLYNKQKLTTGEKDRMVTLAGELVDTLPDLKKYYNEETGLIETTSDKLTALIEAYKAKAKTEAMQDALKEYYSAQAEANRITEEAESNVKKLKDEEERRRWIDEKLAEQLVALQNEQEKYGMEIPGIQEKITDLTERQDANTAAMEHNKKLQEEQADVIKDAKSAYDQAQKGIDSITKSYMSLSDETETATNKAKELSHELDVISRTSKITIEATLDGIDVSMQEKIDVIAEVTGVDYTGLPVSEKTIDNMYGQIVETYTKGGFRPKIDASADLVSWKQLFPKPGVPSLFNADAWIATFSKPAVRALFNADTWKQLFAKPGVATQFNANTWKQLFSKPGVGAQANLNSVKDQIKAGNKYISGVKAGVTSLKKVGSPILSFSGNLSRAGGNRYTMSLREHGGVFSHGRWTNIVQYATGGRPSHGTVFAAGENGAEIVGRIGGRTEVLNQSQIASAIFSAVSTAINVTLPHIVSQIVQSNATIASMISGTLNSLSNAFEAYTMPQVNVGLTDTNRINAFREAMSMAIDMDRAVTNAQYAEILSRLDSEEYRFVAQMDGRAIFDEVVSRNDLFRSQTGRTAFA